MKKLLTVVLSTGLAIFLMSCGADKGVEQQLQENTVEVSDETEDNPEEVKSSSEEELFQEFLNGECKAVLDYDESTDLQFVCGSYEEVDGETQFVSLWNGAEELSLDKITQMMNDTPDLDMSNLKTSYAILETRSRGKALVVRYRGIGIQASADGCAYFVFTADQGKLNFVYACESWARNYTELHEGVVFSGHGSNGAGDSMQWYSCIDETGHYKTICSMRELYDFWAADYAGMDDADDGYEGTLLYIVNTGKESYYSYSVEDGLVQDKLKGMCDKLEEMGIVKTDDAWELANKAMEDAGIDPDQIPVITKWINMETGEPEED